ncbi:MAG: FAD-dependent oxidoreductase [Leptospira sp.]|nr:FAD-dependent oxidoreductase [Leptospira sp.]
MFVVVGSGIIGTWIALSLAKKGEEVYVIEKSEQAGDGISGRNSGVLHSGIYYDVNSLKSEMCFRGYDLSLSFFETNKIPFKLCGKVITIGLSDNVEEEKSKLEELEKLYQNGVTLGIKGMELFEKPSSRWQHLLGNKALWIPKTGIVDVPNYLKILWNLASNLGVQFLKRKKMKFINNSPVLVDSLTGEKEDIVADHFINAAGLYSDELALDAGLEGYEIRPNKGEYFRLKRNLPYETLVYPLPMKTSTALGVHYTFNLGGDAYAGPNSNWAESKEDYKFVTNKSEYYKSIMKILDFYSEDDLVEGYVGLRPRLFYNNNPIKDFQIISKGNWTHLLGIESPGLTSSPAIAEKVLLQLGI